MFNVWNIEFAAGYLIYVQTSNQNHIITIFERKFQYFLQKFHEAPNLLCYINTNIPKAAHFKRKQITLIWFIFNFQSKPDFTLEHCSNQNGFCCCWKTVLLKNRVDDVNAFNVSIELKMYPFHCSKNRCENAQKELNL